MQPAYVVELALELELLVCPCGAHQSNRLIRIGPAPFVGSVKRPELLFQQPVPRPAISRPLQRMSTVANSFARCTALRYGTTITLVPILIFFVTAATYPSVGNGSSRSVARTVPVCAGIRIWSLTQIEA